MWPKFANFIISMKEVIIPSIYKNLTREINFLSGALGSSPKIENWHYVLA